MENPNFVLPKVFMIGATEIDMVGIVDYLNYTNQHEFLTDINQAQSEGINNGEILCSMFAKICYASLTTEKNKNITKVRSIANNIISTIESKHGSVFEHCSINFIITDCSRVFTHELVRHRVGTAFSQTSGRYVRNDVIKLVIDPILEPVYREIEEHRVYTQNIYKEIEKKLGIDTMTDFDKKKKLTSAMRRILQNGQANEIGFSLNLRTLRLLTEMRTSRQAEWEIRLVFNQITQIIGDKYKLIMKDASFINVDNQNEITFVNKKI